MNKLLTISIAAYNVEEFLGRAIESCLSNDELQPLIEVIVIDDGSHDNTGNIADEYALKYPDCVRSFHKENGGHGSTINYALKHAKGKYFKILDGDDAFDSDGLIRLLKDLQDGVDLIITDLAIIDCDDRVIGQHKIADSIQGISKLRDLDNSVIFKMHNVCFKTEILKSNSIWIDEKCFYVDVEYTILPLQYVDTIKAIPVVLYLYRKGRDEQSTSIVGVKRHYRDSRVVLNTLLKSFAGCQQNDVVIAQVCAFYKKTISNYLLGEKISKTRASIKEIDNEVRALLPNMIDGAKNKTLLLLHATNYHIAPFLALLYRRVKWLQR